MTDRRPEKLYIDDGFDWAGQEYREATLDQIVAVVRRGVESGTIEGMEMRARNKAQADRMGQTEPGIYIVLGPVSDGGSET